MAGPHIFGSSFVTCFMIFTISKQSLRFCLSSTLLKNSSTLASFTFVFISAIFDSLHWLRQIIAPLFCVSSSRESKPPNGLRYRRLGGLRKRHFAGTNRKPRKLPENAQTPRRRVHAVLGRF